MKTHSRQLLSLITCGCLVAQLVLFSSTAGAAITPKVDDAPPTTSDVTALGEGQSGHYTPGGGLKCSTDGTSSGPTPEVPEDIAKKETAIWQFLIGKEVQGKKLEAVHVAGIMGNMKAESAGYVSNRVEYGKLNSRGEVSVAGTPTSVDETPSAAGYGIFQYTPGTKIVPFAQAAGKAPGDLFFQLDLVLKQLDGKANVTVDGKPISLNEGAAGLRLMQTTTLGDEGGKEGSVAAFEYGFERHAPNAQTSIDRLRFGGEFLKLYGSVGASEISAPTTCNPAAAGNTGTGEYKLPIDLSFYEKKKDIFSSTHHDIPAIDIPVPSGTIVYAIMGGVVRTNVNDPGPNGYQCGEGVAVTNGDIEIMYCHGSDGGRIEGAKSGNTVVAGQTIMTSGYTGHVDPPGPGGAHLHVQIRVAGQLRCPQTFLNGIATGNIPDIRSLPAQGCTH